MAGQLQEANTKLTALTRANNFLEKQIEETGLSRKSLEDELSKVKEQLLSQGQTSASLRENIDALKQALEQKEKERLVLADELNKLTSQRVSLESELLNTKTTLLSKDQELKQKIQDLENINLLYNNLKIQLPQISNLLIQKDLELDNALRENAAFKEELMTRNQEKEALQFQLQVTEKDISNLRLKYQDLETELTLARQQQKRMMGELNKAATLNASLQQSLVGLSQSMTQEEENKEKAQNLKSKIEVILTPKQE